MTSAEKPSLYERLGGVYSIATVVDDLIDRVMVDPRLNANPLVDEAHHRVPPAGFKYLVTEVVCWASGDAAVGPDGSPHPLPLFEDLRVCLVYDFTHFRERLPAPVPKFLDLLVD